MPNPQAEETSEQADRTAYLFFSSLQNRIQRFSLRARKRAVDLCWLMETLELDNRDTDTQIHALQRCNVVLSAVGSTKATVGAVGDSAREPWRGHTMESPSEERKGRRLVPA